MARAQSWNIEVEIEGQIIHPLSFGEFSEGEVGRIEVADGNRKYMIGDQIFSVGEIPMTVLIKDDKRDFRICKEAALGGRASDVFVRFRDAAGTVKLSYLLAQCEVLMGKKNAFDRKSKSEDSQNFVLAPTDVTEIQ